MWDEYTRPFTNFNGVTVEVWEWISNFIPIFYWTCDYLSMLGLKLSHIRKKRPLVYSYELCHIMMISHCLWCVVIYRGRIHSPGHPGTCQMGLLGGKIAVVWLLVCLEARLLMFVFESCYHDRHAILRRILDRGGVLLKSLSLCSLLSLLGSIVI